MKWRAGIERIRLWACGQRFGSEQRSIGIARLRIASALFLSLLVAAPASASDDENDKVSEGLGVYIEPMRIEGSITYGAFFDLHYPDRYDIKVDVAVPGRRPAHVGFQREHLTQ
jgi:hypothetical protein